ncbi:MAG: glutamine synthetase, partial [Syntrophobacteraceae bacterium]
MEPKATQASVKKKMKEDGIEFILAQFVDIHGSPKVKQVPVECFDDIVEDGAGFAGAAVWGVGQGPHNHDLMARADVDTYQQLPWKENVALFSSNLYVDGEPHPYCPRGNLLRITKLFA